MTETAQHAEKTQSEDSSSEDKKKERSDSSEKEGESESKSSSGSGPQVGTRFSAEEIHDNVSKAAKEELDRPASELIWSSLASGLLLGFSFLSVAFATSLVPPAYHTLATAIAYPIGFLYVVHARHQLFTENTLEPVIPLLEKRDRETFGQLLRLWAIVLPLNLVGALIFAEVLAHTQVVEPKLLTPLLDAARVSTEGSAQVIFYKGIWAGWLIALMAWLIAATHDTSAQILLVWLATAPIAAFGFRHSIAGAVEAFYRAAVGDAPWSQMIFSFEIPAILGNIVGGVVLVALLNHGQVSKARES
jgi:formate/nitrite transporter FocA (FNT family)